MSNIQFREEGHFEWTENQTVKYTNWDVDQPNDFGSGEDCAIMNSNKLRSELKDKDWTWIDQPCEKSSHFNREKTFSYIALCETVNKEIV